MKENQSYSIVVVYAMLLYKCNNSKRRVLCVPSFDLGIS